MKEYWRLAILKEYNEKEKDKYPFYKDCIETINYNWDDFYPVFVLHERVAQTYDDVYPYAYHLAQVINTAGDFMPGDIPDSTKNMLCLAAAMHDCIEDARMTYNDVQKFIANYYQEKFKLSDKQVTQCADIVYALTDEKGRNRKERHSDKYWKILKATFGAAFIKMCDRLANIQYSKKTGSRMYKVYLTENAEFLQNIRGAIDLPKYIKLYDYLNNLY